MTARNEVTNRDYNALLNDKIPQSSFVTLNLPKGKAKGDGDTGDKISLWFYFLPIFYASAGSA
jgi:hypothetical protein